jgi:hypothetical protein
MLAVTASLPLRYRRSDPVLRVQLRWIIAAIAILPPTVAPLFIARYALGAPPEVGEALMMLAAIGGCAFPVATAMAITRHHLFGIERLVERALVYVPLMAILAGLYAATIALFQRIFMAVTGTSSEITVVLSTLILASMFTPIRQALERFVDRRFNPKKPEDPLVTARVVGEPSIVPPAAVMVDLAHALHAGGPARDAARAEDRNAARVDDAGDTQAAEAAAETSDVAAAGTSDAATAQALLMLAERLAALESRLARLEEPVMVIERGPRPSTDEDEEADELDALLGEPERPPASRELTGERRLSEARRTEPRAGAPRSSEARVSESPPLAPEGLGAPASQPSLGS